MKIKRLSILYFCIISLLFVSIFSTLPSLLVFADVPTNQKVVKHTTTSWTGYPFDYRLHNAYFTVDNTSNVIPSSTTNTPIYFYTADNETFYSLSGKDVYTTVLNRGIGITTVSDILTLLVTDFWNYAALPNSSNFVQGGLYDQSNQFLGYCLNDISDCYYVDLTAPNKPAVTIPSDFTNDVYNHYKYYTGDVDVDYFTFYPSSPTYLANNINFQNTYGGLDKTVFQNFVVDNVNSALQTYSNAGYMVTSDTYTQTFVEGNTWPRKFLAAFDLNNRHVLYTSNANRTWQAFCQYFELVGDNKELLFTDMLAKKNSTDTVWIDCNIRDNDGTVNNSGTVYQFQVSNNQPVSSTATQSINSYLQIGVFNVPSVRTTLGQPYTVYKDEETYQNIKTKNYEPDSFNDTNYKNYNTNNDNSFTVSTTTIDNSQNINQSIYDDSLSYFNENISVDNSTINIENITNNTSTIINNYYPSESNPDDPEDPDNPVDDDTVLDAILAALKRFFDVIGKILGTVLAGILEVIDSVLESIAGIMEGLGGITDFIGALFSWIPSPVPQILGVGISICILAAIFKFIRG